MNPLAILGIGLALGIRHAADPDHVVAVTAIAARTRGAAAAARLGVVWGLGHSLTLFAVGGGIILFNLVVPPRLGLALELAVAIALIAVGALNLGAGHRGAGRSGTTGAPLGRTFAVGLVHGLAGSAAVALLVLATVHDPRLGCAYLGVFALGTLAGMTLVTVGFSLPVRASGARWPGFGRGLRIGTGALSLAFGLWLVARIGWVDGLFLGAARWTPR